MSARAISRESFVPASERQRNSGVFEMRKHERRELNARVTLSPPSGEAIEGWTLNISDGGVRVIAEQRLALGDELTVEVHAEAEYVWPRVARVVWVQHETDGSVAGMQFIDHSGVYPVAAPKPPPLPIAANDVMALADDAEIMDVTDADDVEIDEDDFEDVSECADLELVDASASRSDDSEPVFLLRSSLPTDWSELRKKG